MFYIIDFVSGYSCKKGKKDLKGYYNSSINACVLFIIIGFCFFWYFFNLLLPFLFLNFSHCYWKFKSRQYCSDIYMSYFFETFSEKFSQPQFLKHDFCYSRQFLKSATRARTTRRRRWWPKSVTSTRKSSSGSDSKIRSTKLQSHKEEKLLKISKTLKLHRRLTLQNTIQLC